MKDTFQNWKVGECIGNGAFGKVYKIVRTEFGQTYEAALKVLEIPQHSSEVETIRHEGMSENNITEYFESVVEDLVKEFALMSKLKGNSHIVSYEDHDVVRKKDSFGWEIYIRMELLTPLYTYTEQHQMTVSDVIKMGIHLCKALELCERHHIIHRDIKPENIFVSNNGDFKLGDFGISRELEKTSCDLSKKGTKSYMAPEVYKGMEYNFSVDIYSLGIVLYRFLNNNRLPFYPNAPEPIRYSDKEEATLLRMCGNEMPKPCNASSELADIILKACAYIPSKRYGSAKEMREDLERVYQVEQATADEGLKKKVAFDVKEKKQQKEGIQEDFQAIVGEETECFFKGENTESLNENEYTVAMFRGQEGDSQSHYENLQEETMLLEHERQENILKEHLKEKQPIKKRSRAYVGIAICCLMILFILFGMWEKNKVQQVGQAVEQTENLLCNIVSGTSVTEHIKSVPNVVGMEWKEAKKTLTSIGLHVQVERKYDSSTKKGIVIRQSLDAEILVEEGEQITLVVSKGKRPQPTEKPTPQPTPMPTLAPTEKPMVQSTQKPAVTSGSHGGGTNATPKPAVVPYNNDVDESGNEVQRWNPDE